MSFGGALFRKEHMSVTATLSECGGWHEAAKRTRPFDGGSVVIVADGAPADACLGFLVCQQDLLDVKTSNTVWPAYSAFWSGCCRGRFPPGNAIFLNGKERCLPFFS